MKTEDGGWGEGDRVEGGAGERERGRKGKRRASGGERECLYENGRQREAGKVTVRYGRSSGRRKGTNADEDAEGGNAVNGLDFIFHFQRYFRCTSASPSVFNTVL